MIQKNKSRKTAMLKYGLSAPLFVLMLILTSATVNRTPATQANATAENMALSIAKPQTKDKVYTAVAKEPVFPGGFEKFKAFLGRNIKYPKEMRAKKIQGKVYMSFIVETDGSLSDVKVVRDIGHGAGAEAMRVMNLSPKWEPGTQNNKKVRVAYTVPITFTL